MISSAMDVEKLLDEEYRAIFDALSPVEADASDLPSVVAVLRARAAAKSAPAPKPKLPDDVTVEDRRVPGPAGASDVLVRLYRPNTRRSPAAFYWIHSGGLVMGTVQKGDAYCAGVASKLQVLVASVDYRLAPEHPYPAPLEDCYAGLRWLHAAAGELEIERRRIAIGGASAGGGLCAGLALLARDRGQLPVCFQLLVYPMIDDRNETRSSHAVKHPRIWNRTTNLAAWDAYLAGRAGSADVPPYAAPARAHDLAGLPPTYITVGALDLFVDEDIAFAHALMHAGVPVELHVYPGCFHGSPTIAPGTSVSRRWAADELAALERALNAAK